MNLRQAAEMALSALETARCYVYQMDALRAALAEADETVPLAEYKKLQALVTAQGIRLMDAESDEPVAWMDADGNTISHAIKVTLLPTFAALYPVPLYAHPPRREPLTEDEIIKLGVCNGVLPLLHDDTHDELVRIARWVERAHGIGTDE